MVHGLSAWTGNRNVPSFVSRESHSPGRDNRPSGMVPFRLLLSLRTAEESLAPRESPVSHVPKELEPLNDDLVLSPGFERVPEREAKSLRSDLENIVLPGADAIGE